jgi:hypothetical protein
MRKIFQKIAGIVWRISTVGLLLLLAYSAADKQFEVPTTKQIAALDNVNNSSSLYNAALVSRQSAVKVVSLNPEDLSLAAASGTYVTIGDRYFILTVAHGLNSTCEYVRFVAGNTEYDEHYIKCKKIIEINVFTDYAIIEVNKINALSPVLIKNKIPKNNDWKKSFASLSELIYTGHPNNIGIMTVQGRVMGYSEDDHVFMHSYGWEGASGSGVFNHDGQLVGYVMAILIGETIHGINVLEDVVVVVPLFKVDWSVVFHR